VSDSGYIVELLRAEGLVSAESIDAALGACPDGSGEAGIIEALIKRGDLTREAVTGALAQAFGMECVDLIGLQVPEEALRAVSGEIVESQGVFPFRLQGKQLDLAVSDPFAMDAVDDIRHMTGLLIDTWLASPESIREAIERHYGGSRSALTQADPGDPVAGEESVDFDDGDREAGDAPIIRYVRTLIVGAIKRRASDIHLEPLERRFRVRFRIDGSLVEGDDPPKRLQASIISRLKLMANMSIAEKRQPQDGRIRLQIEGTEVDLRVSSLPTVYGESVVMRILDREGLRLGLEELGFFSDDQAIFEQFITLPDGMLLVTGPTGSGKTTTLYSCLHFVNKPDRKIITVEDPVEYELPGINQVQVRRDVGMTFAAALRAILRQAPHIIMFGEIRDSETAEIAVNASLTGHLVFSTLHTNDAPSAVSRLVDIGVKPFLVAASLRAAMAQRLVRVVCPRCRQPASPDERQLNALGLGRGQANAAKFMSGAGCPQCLHSGYYGRRGIFEIFEITEEVREMIYNQATLLQLRRKAHVSGMRSMRDDGIRKAVAGLTTVDEVLAVTVGDWEGDSVVHASPRLYFHSLRV